MAMLRNAFVDYVNGLSEFKFNSIPQDLEQAEYGGCLVLTLSVREE